MSNERLRLFPTFDIGYDDDIDAVTRLLVDLAAEDPEILADPARSG